MIIQNNRSALAAGELHHQLGWTCPEDFTLEEIANAMGIIVKDVPIKGSEGRILMKGNTGIISLNETINHPGKRNFVLAHEIGHFILHKDLTPLFSDTNKTLSDWYKNGEHESQANEFAVEFLMPSDLFRRKQVNKKLSIALINEISSYFKTSLTATFLRYITHGSFPLMVIFMENGIVKWKRASTDFPFTWLPINSAVPAWTVAGDYFKNGKLESFPERVDAIEWFAEDFKISNNEGMKLFEQCYKVSDKGLISCLWTN
jgi:Zn-dependent peptidase ImmA (M78 family)